jgi:hypothetical protein
MTAEDPTAGIDSPLARTLPGSYLTVQLRYHLARVTVDALPSRDEPRQPKRANQGDSRVPTDDKGLPVASTTCGDRAA